MKVILRLSANTGPEECCLGVAKLLDRIEVDARKSKVDIDVLEQQPGLRSGTLQSVAVSLSGPDRAIEELCSDYVGSVLWVCESPYRRKHPRKNWFLLVARMDGCEMVVDGEVVIETMRSSGPGGQHVNKTESAVRATHLGTGISVKVSDSRSQGANKAAALTLLQLKLRQLEDQLLREQRGRTRKLHCGRPSGNLVARFVGPKFERAG